LSRHFTHQDEVVFHNRIPSYEEIAEKFEDIDAIGLYLHIPFCHQICPYCPYNKELFQEDTCRRYVHAIIAEIDRYASILLGKPVTSFYIGGGTPTTMIGKGMEKIIDHMYKRFNMNCEVHMESHPNDLTEEALRAMEGMGVKYLSIGVEALQDRHLRVLERPYTVKEVQRSIERAGSRNFTCVNIDYIFDLPSQTIAEVGEAGWKMSEMKIHQVATYPMFRFPFTRFGRQNHKNGNALATMFRRRKFMKILEEIFYKEGFERSSVWAFTRKGTDKYCSVTVPLYVGLGASGGSYLKDVFYINTFSVREYIHAVKASRPPIALSTDLTDEMQMAGWLYWRLYETKFDKADFFERFNRSFDGKYGMHMRMMRAMGFLTTCNGQVRLSDKGAYWIHAFEDFFSISYINKLWGMARKHPWPEHIAL
jgi:oxygen-independent coproporphyrinogen-3 oxidase